MLLDLLPSELLEILISYVEYSDYDNFDKILNRKIDYMAICRYRFGKGLLKGKYGYKKYLGCEDLYTLFDKVRTFTYHKNPFINKYLHINAMNRISIPPSIAEFSHLRELWIYDYPKIDLPKELKYLHNLEKFTVEESRLVSIPEVIFSLKNLTYLHISKSSITEIPSSIQALNKLEYINFYGNQIYKISNELYVLPSLKYLILTDNKLKTLPRVGGTSGSLRTIELRQNPLTSLPIGFEEILLNVEQIYVPDDCGNIRTTLINCGFHNIYGANTYRKDR
jgi:hypothetical protein